MHLVSEVTLQFHLEFSINSDDSTVQCPSVFADFLCMDFVIHGLKNSEYPQCKKYENLWAIPFRIPPGTRQSHNSFSLCQAVLL